MKKPPIPQPPPPRQIKPDKPSTMKKIVFYIIMAIILSVLSLIVPIPKRASQYPIHIHETEFDVERDRAERYPSDPYYFNKSMMWEWPSMDYIWMVGDSGTVWVSTRDSQGNITITNPE